MTRRSALLSLPLFATAGQFSPRGVTPQAVEASGLTVRLGPSLGLTRLVVEHPEGEIVISWEEIVKTLTHQHRPMRFGDAPFIVGAGRTLELCADCGQTYWPGKGESR